MSGPLRLRSVLGSALSMLLLQAGWVACVAGAGRGILWLGPVVVGGLIALHLINAAHRRRDLEVILALGLVGTLVDSLQSAVGLLRFRGAPSPLLCPLWITALWLHFGTVVRTGLAPLRHRLGWAALVGSIGGPLAYGAGVRLDAATLAPAAWTSLLSVALVWGSILPLALRFAWRPMPPRRREP